MEYWEYASNYWIHKTPVNTPRWLPANSAGGARRERPRLLHNDGVRVLSDTRAELCALAQVLPSELRDQIALTLLKVHHLTRELKNVLAGISGTSVLDTCSARAGTSPNRPSRSSEARICEICQYHAILNG